MNMCVGKTTSVQQFAIRGALGVGQIDYAKDDPRADEDEIFSEDVLSVFTYHTRTVLFGIGELVKQFKLSPFYRILFHTTQPAHLVVTVAVSIVAYLLLTNKEQTVHFSPLWTFVYLVSISTHFGAQIWMTFVSGLGLYFSLPRHTFGSVQKVLFPMYFLLNSGLSLVTLALFVRHNNTSMGANAIIAQTAILTMCFLVELFIRVYWTPPLILLIDQKTSLEKKVGVGMEIGKHDPGDLVNCPHYVKVHKAFRKVHMRIAIGNIFTLACTVIHLHYLAHKICVL